MRKWLKYLLYVIVILFVLVLLAIVQGNKMIKRNVRQKESVETMAFIEKQVKEVKAQLPIRNDDGTLLCDYDISLAERAIVWTYKFDQTVNNETIRNTIFGDMRERLKKRLCEDENFLKSTKMGLKFKIMYIDMNNQLITSYFLDDSDCS